MNEDTKKVLTEGETLRLLIEGDGWALARGKLVNLILDLQNINNLDASDPQALIVDLKARKTAADILYGWLRDIEGTAEQHVNNQPARVKPQSEEYINIEK